jgi:hypothetical protein
MQLLAFLSDRHEMILPPCAIICCCTAQVPLLWNRSPEAAAAAATKHTLHEMNVRMR